MDRCELVLSSGRCPECATQIKIVTDDCVIYKTRLFKINNDGTYAIKCPSCKIFVSDSK